MKVVKNSNEFSFSPSIMENLDISINETHETHETPKKIEEQIPKTAV
jgi:hypothetical protein